MSCHCKATYPRKNRSFQSGAIYLSNTSLLALAAANVIPLFGAIFWGWDAGNIVLLYWAENLAVGFYNVLKIAFAKVS
ncbi:MAG: DUF6498-containing protein, partial [Planctomycetota bacterium]